MAMEYAVVVLRASPPRTWTVLLALAADHCRVKSQSSATRLDDPATAALALLRSLAMPVWPIRFMSPSQVGDAPTVTATRDSSTRQSFVATADRVGASLAM